MKKIIVISILTLLFQLTFANSFTQIDEQPISQSDKQSHKETIAALKVGYMTEKVGLTPAESQKFWAIYNQYWKERRDAAHSVRDFHKRVENNDINNDDLVLLFSLQDNETAIMRRWAEKFKTILSPQKVVKVFVAEEGFKRYLMTQKK